ncbi:MAG: amino acid ABC transporter permease [Pseudobutyrivibrio sp.]|nr:amino acid ABC transporter permease [Pseudobutyrivibrio sp.]
MEEFIAKFTLDFIEKDRWKFITDGLQITLLVTILAVFFGILIGMIVAIIRCAHDQMDPTRIKGFPKFILKLINTVVKLYVTVIRGTPVLVQLLIMYFIIMVSNDSKITVAVVTFSINSGAYVSEIFRGGIMALDKGQMEAGRSLGLNYIQTMIYIILPQAFKSVQPALCNELIALLKETSICGYIGLNELTRGGDIIRGTTFDALLPLFTVALIYLILVLGLTAIFARLERRLRASDNR